MQLYVCGGKQTQNNNTMYLLRDVRSNKETVVDGNKLKDAMRSKKVDVMNLTLTSDNRLVEASKDKMAQLSGLLRAPYSLIDILEPLNTNHLDCVESIMDEIIKDSIEAYVKENKKYVKISNINKENNTFVLEFTLGLNSYVMCHYEKLIYGEIGDKVERPVAGAYGHTYRNPYRKDLGAVCFDIGIQVIAISNKRASSKIGSGAVALASKSINTYSIDGDAIRLNYKNSDTGLIWDDKDIDRLKEKLGHFILSHIAKELVGICDSNPDIANNTNVTDYIKYDEARKEYATSLAVYGAFGLGSAVVMSAIFTLLITISPDTIQTGLLAKIADIGSTQEIIKYIIGLSGIPGTISGLTITTKAMNDAGMFKSMKLAHDGVKYTKDNKKKDWMGMLGKR